MRCLDANRADAYRVPRQNLSNARTPARRTWPFTSSAVERETWRRWRTSRTSPGRSPTLSAVPRTAGGEPMSVLIPSAGIGGLAAALSRHRLGFRDVAVFEAARDSGQNGVKLNVSVRVLAERAGTVAGESGPHERAAVLQPARDSPGVNLAASKPDATGRSPRCVTPLLTPPCSARRASGWENALLSRRRTSPRPAPTPLLWTSAVVRGDRAVRLTGKVVPRADGIGSAVRASLYPRVGPRK